MKRLFSSSEKTDDHVVLNGARVTKILHGHMQDRIQQAIAQAKKELRKEMDNFLDAQDMEMVKQLTNPRTIGCLLDNWLERKEGKRR